MQKWEVAETADFFGSATKKKYSFHFHLF